MHVFQSLMKALGFLDKANFFIQSYTGDKRDFLK